MLKFQVERERERRQKLSQSLFVVIPYTIFINNIQLKSSGSYYNVGTYKMQLCTHTYTLLHLHSNNRVRM